MKTCLLFLILFMATQPLFSQSDPTQTQIPDSTIYACPMHPDITSNKPGKCPKCGMDLIQQASSEARKMNMMMCPMHGMVDMDHKHDERKKDKMKMMKGMGIGAGVMMVVMMIILISN